MWNKLLTIAPTRALVSLLAPALLMLASFPSLRAAEPKVDAGTTEEAESGVRVQSPGGRFVFQKLGPGRGYGVIEGKSGKPVSLEGIEADGITPVGDQVIAALWSNDGRRLAINYRAGGRYETTQLFVWRDGKFESMQDVEDPLIDRIERDRAAFLKREKLPAKTPLRRIWDTFRTQRWVNDSSVEVFVTSTRSFLRNEDDDEPEDLTISGVFTIQFGKDGKPGITTRRAATKKELGEEE